MPVCFATIFAFDLEDRFVGIAYYDSTWYAQVPYWGA